MRARRVVVAERSKARLLGMLDWTRHPRVRPMCHRKPHQNAPRKPRACPKEALRSTGRARRPPSTDLPGPTAASPSPPPTTSSSSQLPNVPPPHMASKFSPQQRASLRPKHTDTCHDDGKRLNAPAAARCTNKHGGGTRRGEHATPERSAAEQQRAPPAHRAPAVPPTRWGERRWKPPEAAAAEGDTAWQGRQGRRRNGRLSTQCGAEVEGGPQSRHTCRDGPPYPCTQPPPGRSPRTRTRSTPAPHPPTPPHHPPTPSPPHPRHPAARREGQSSKTSSLR